jgi:hypothetical protein
MTISSSGVSRLYCDVIDSSFAAGSCSGLPEPEAALLSHDAGMAAMKSKKSLNGARDRFPKPVKDPLNMLSEKGFFYSSFI